MNMSRLHHYGFCAALLLTLAPGAQSQVIQLTSSAQLNPADTTFLYPQPEFTSVASPYATSVGGNTLTFTTMNGDPFTRLDQGSGFAGNFPNGTPLLANFGSGPDDITFATPVGEVGVGAQSDAVANHLFTITAYAGANPLLIFTVPGDGFVSFIGVQSLNGDVITRLHIASDDNNFDIGPVTFGSPVPEPGSVALLVGIGISGSVFFRRRKNARKAA